MRIYIEIQQVYAHCAYYTYLCTLTNMRAAEKVLNAHSVIKRRTI